MNTPSPYIFCNPNDVTEAERNYAGLIHLSLYATLFASAFGLVVPFALWYSRRKESRFIDQHGRAVMNLGLTVFFGSIFFLIAVSIIAGLVANMLAASPALVVGFWIVTILSAIATYILAPIYGWREAKKGKEFDYRFTLPIL